VLLDEVSKKRMDRRSTCAVAAHERSVSVRVTSLSGEISTAFSSSPARRSCGPGDRGARELVAHLRIAGALLDGRLNFKYSFLKRSWLQSTGSSAWEDRAAAASSFPSRSRACKLDLGFLEPLPPRESLGVFS